MHMSGFAVGIRQRLLRTDNSRLLTISFIASLFHNNYEGTLAHNCARVPLQNQVIVLMNVLKQVFYINEYH